MITISTRFDGISVAFIITDERITVATANPAVPPRAFVTESIGRLFSEHELHVSRTTVVPDFRMHALFLAIEYTAQDLGAGGGGYAERMYEELVGAL